VSPATRPKTTQPLRKQASARRLICLRITGSNKQERRATEAVGTVDTSGDLTAGEETWDHLATAIKDPGLVVNLDSAHSLPQRFSL
jgi:hypothetical protein